MSWVFLLCSDVQPLYRSMLLLRSIIWSTRDSTMASRARSTAFSGVSPFARDGCEREGKTAREVSRCFLVLRTHPSEHLGVV